MKQQQKKQLQLQKKQLQTANEATATAKLATASWKAASSKIWCKQSCFYTRQCMCRACMPCGFDGNVVQIKRTETRPEFQKIDHYSMTKLLVFPPLGQHCSSCGNLLTDVLKLVRVLWLEQVQGHEQRIWITKATLPASKSKSKY